MNPPPPSLRQAAKNLVQLIYDKVDRDGEMGDYERSEAEQAVVNELQRQRVEAQAAVWRAFAKLCDEQSEEMIVKKWNIYRNRKFIGRAEMLPALLKEECDAQAQAGEREGGGNQCSVGVPHPAHDWCKGVSWILAHDAALRARVAELEQVMKDHQDEACSEQLDTLQARLAAVQNEAAKAKYELAEIKEHRLTDDGHCAYCNSMRAGWLSECTNPIHTEGLPRVNDLKAQLQDREATVGELQELNAGHVLNRIDIEGQFADLREAVKVLKETLSYVQIHAPGYDWNADPLSLTLQTGNAFQKAELVLCEGFDEQNDSLQKQLESQRATITRLEADKQVLALLLSARTQKLDIFAEYIKRHIPECWAGPNPDATEQAAVAWLQARQARGEGA